MLHQAQFDTMGGNRTFAAMPTEVRYAGQNGPLLHLLQRQLWVPAQSSGYSCIINQFGLLTMQLCTIEVPALNN
jgi:hypothetical protein